MTKKTFCPKCFTEINRDYIMFECQDRAKKHGIGDDKRFVPPRRIYTKKTPKSGICPVCEEISRKYICPNPKCGSTIEVIENAEIIAITGVKSSGKTVYISALIQEIVRRLPNEFGIEAEVSDETDSIWRNTYYIEENKPLPMATQRGLLKPVIIHLKKGKKELSLVLYDASGEEFRRKDKIVDNLKQLSHSSLIIMLIDALQIPIVHNHPDMVAFRLNHPIQEGNDRILDSVIAEIKEATNLRGKISTPIAACISLSDVLTPIYKNRVPVYLENSKHGESGCFEVQNFFAIQTSVKEQLSAWEQNNFLRKLDRGFESVAFFGFSALGQNPDVIQNVVRKYAPQNVLDPILWLLASRNMIEIKK